MTASPPVSPASATAAGEGVLAPVLEFLRRHAPFDRMAPQHLEYLAKHLRLGFYARGDAITTPGDQTANTFYIVKQGRVRGEAQDGVVTEEGAWELVAGECFPIGALMSRRPVRTVHRAAEDSFCFELDRADFEHLLAQSPVFQDFCSRRLANLLDEALRGVHSDRALHAASDGAFARPLRDLIRRAPVTCTPGSSIREALAAMNASNVGSVVIVDGARRPLGIFTLHDLLARVLGANLSLDGAIGQVMSPEPRSLPANAFAHDAALLMATSAIRHVCVVQDGRLVGVISERDLFALQRIGIVNLTRAITSAERIEHLVALGQDVHRLIDQMLAQGVSLPQLMELVTRLNDHLTRRAIDLVLAQAPAVGVPFAWLAFGSEGRGEQTLKTDQDNGILFQPPTGLSVDAARERLLPLAERINDALARIGFPLCPGQIMARNPECCLTLEEWRARFHHWITQGTPEHLLRAGIFFDLRTLHGDPAPAEELRRAVLREAAATPRFRRLMAENALRNRPPLGVVRDFLVSSGGERPHTLDLKLNGAMPFIDGARLLALAQGVEATGTTARLEAAAAAGHVSPDEVQAWGQAFAFIQLLRMRHHQEQARRGEALDNHVDPYALSELDRRILKEAFRQARKLQARLALDYQL